MIRLGLALLTGLVWWRRSAPRPEIEIAGPLHVDGSTAAAVAAVDHSADFARDLERFPSDLPGIDDLVFVDAGATALVTATDRRIWTVDTRTHAAEPFVELPSMAYGLHEAPDDPDRVYLCVAGSYGGLDGTGAVAPGLYRLTRHDRSIEPLVVEVPADDGRPRGPVVYADDDPTAPEAGPGRTGPRRPLAVCDNLDVSDDGRRIYFSEPFDYTGASVDDAVDEAIALAPNGRLWRHDLDTGTTRLVAAGFHFVNAVLLDPHPERPREESVLVTQTSMFRLTRFHLRGPRAGAADVVLDGLPGMADGMDRDADGRIWVALFAERGRLVTWVHAHAWVKPLVMRLPARLLLRQAGRTGVLVVSPDGSTPLWSAMYRGPELVSVASAVPNPEGVYLANESLTPGREARRGVIRLRWPTGLR
ncbi:SMP-30/gluconolactonase/LRE family protein [Geodermatophilus poikilotrophus]|uniref:SMP-30/Gluconolaconase/LRE-like region-containing protein n=1 Tax=Geodermatophilus poikilotrophus TaxID=1333667 RepID=A0A1I0IPY8_9ACTN|nr:SMP-30/gluconolactonase/LRE family protein [Geodermatophilus poikilotrophus]SET99251.1 SMP-30/Gluconolaconase/LRE-like region-containing protein [Geodermatophilus poikilotrophus]